jgi:hypothetical protein
MSVVRRPARLCRFTNRHIGCWLIVIFGWACKAQGNGSVSKPPAPALDAGARPTVSDDATPGLSHGQRTARLKYNARYPDPGGLDENGNRKDKLGHTSITELAFEILKKHKPRTAARLAAPVGNPPLAGTDLIKYGTDWADHPWIGRPADPKGIVYNPVANQSDVFHNISSDPQKIRYDGKTFWYTVDPPTGLATWQQQVNSSSDTDWDVGEGVFHIVLNGATYMDGPRWVPLTEMVPETDSEGTTTYYPVIVGYDVSFNQWNPYMAIRYQADVSVHAGGYNPLYFLGGAVNDFT